MGQARKRPRRRRRSGVLLVLLALLFGVSGGGAWLASTRGTPSRREWEARRLLPELQAAAVVALVLEEPPREAVEVARGEQGSWEIVAPRRLPADRLEVEEVLRWLQGAEVLASIPVPAGGDLHPWGLEAPSLRLEVRTGDGRRREVLVGSEAVGSGHFLLRRGPGLDPAVITVRSSVVEGLRKGLSTLRSKRIFGVEAEQVSVVNVLTPQHTLTLRREGHDWLLEEPLAGAADGPRVRELVQQLASLRTAGYLQEDPGSAVTGLDQPAFRLRLQEDAGAGAGEWLDIGAASAEGARYARLGPDLLLVPETLTRELLRDPGRFRARDLLDIPPDRVEQVQVRRPGRTPVRLGQDAAGSWWLREGEGEEEQVAPAEPDLVAGYLRMLDGARVEEFQTAAEGLPEEAGVTVEVTLSDGRRTGYRAATPEPGQALVDLVLLDQPRTVYRVSRELADVPLEAHLRLRSRQVYPPAPSEAPPTRIRLELVRQRAGVVQRYELERQDEAAWVSGDGTPVRDAAVTALALELQHLQAAGYTEGELPPLVQGPDPLVAAVLELSWPEGLTQRRQLTVRGELLTSPGEYVATSEGHPLLVLLMEGTVRRLLVPLE